MKKLYKGLTIIIVLLILCLTGCTRKYNDIVIKDKKDLIEFDLDYYNRLSSGQLPIIIKYDKMTKIHVTTEHGCVYGKIDKYITKGDEFATNWFLWGTGGEKFDACDIDIIIFDEEDIYGYAVVRMSEKTNNYKYKAKIMQSAIFPEVKGKRQNVTIEQVKEIIEKERKVPLSNEKDA